MLYYKLHYLYQIKRFKTHFLKAKSFPMSAKSFEKMITHVFRKYYYLWLLSQDHFEFCVADTQKYIYT